MKITRKELRKMILEEVDPDLPAKSDDQPKEKVYSYFVQRAKKLTGLSGAIAEALAEAYMEGKLTKDEVMKTMLGISAELRHH